MSRRPPVDLQVLFGYKEASPEPHWVMLHHGEATPGLFIAGELQRIFEISQVRAVVHVSELRSRGRTKLGPFPSDVAAIKATAFTTAARSQHYSLLVEPEPVR